ncbi:MAG: hypothetical protein P0111_18240 [Nitrospira sp.]|nr:hypothetical protein [Nitrospira sp.]
MSILFALGICLSGCGVGLNSVLFVTKTEVAVDADTEPPSLDIGYAREEFVLAPAFKDGRVLPVLTTVATDTAAFSLGASHSFATGDAALVMAAALTDEQRYVFSQKATPDVTKVTQPTMESTIGTTLDDKVPHGFWASLGFFLTGSSVRQRYFFGTDTNFGLHVEWGGSELPRSVSIGFKRKELAYVPLIESETPAQGNNPAERKVTLASLIATAHAKASVATQDDSGLKVAQTFATGSAATLLASHPGVREVLGPLLIQDYKDIKEAEFQIRVADRQLKQPLIEWIATAYNAESDSAKKQVFIDEAVSLNLVPTETVKDNFLKLLGQSITPSAPPDTAQRLQTLKGVMRTKYGYKD